MYQRFSISLFLRTSDSRWNICISFNPWFIRTPSSQKNIVQFLYKYFFSYFRVTLLFKWFNSFFHMENNQKVNQKKRISGILSKFVNFYFFYVQFLNYLKLLHYNLLFRGFENHEHNILTLFSWFLVNFFQWIFDLSKYLVTPCIEYVKIYMIQLSKYN